MLKKALRLLSNPNQLKESLEYRRLRKLPHYKPTRTTLLGKPMYLADAPTYLNGIYEIISKGIYTFHSDKKQPLIIDCGANIGLGVVAFKEQYPDARIIAYEADPTISEVLSKNVKTRGYTNTEVVNAAIWINDSGVEFHQEGSFSGRIPTEADGQIKKTKVESVRLADLLAEHVDIDFLKIDIEGSELHVIPDCRSELHRASHVFLEYHSTEGEAQKLEVILDILVGNGFRYHIQEAFANEKPFIQKKKIFSFDNQLNIFAWKNSA